jgi:hypothetical protein
MSIVPQFVPATAARPIIAQSLTKALAHIGFAESIAETDPLLAEQLLALRRITEDLLQASREGMDDAD